jgi:hypothetical protein
VVHLTTLLEDMPITETCEAVADLGPTKIEIGAVIANMTLPTSLDHDRLELAVRGRLPIKVPGLSEVANKALADEFAQDAQRMLDEDARRARLAELGRPIVEVGLDPVGIDVAALFNIADALRDQLPDEINE